MLTNMIVILSTLVIGSVVIYRLQEWNDRLSRQVQLSAAQPATMKILDIAVKPSRQIMGRDDERVSTAISFEIQLPLRAPFVVCSPWMVDASQLANMQKGMLLPVRLDSHSGKVVFPNVSWATYDWRRASQVLPMPTGKEIV